MFLTPAPVVCVQKCNLWVGKCIEKCNNCAIKIVEKCIRIKKHTPEQILRSAQGRFSRGTFPSYQQPMAVHSHRQIGRAHV